MFRNFIVAFEQLLAGFCCSWASPVMLLCVIESSSLRGPSLYKQERIGKSGKAFTIYKFRSMRTDAEDKTGPVLSGQPILG
ncbi:MAG: sugar transferase [Bdellovibrionota bacterium]